jgi:hypothetical protein
MSVIAIVQEESTAVFVASFEDEDGQAVTPNSVSWTLTDEHKNVINERDGEELTPDTSVDIVLSGDDLAIGSNGERRFLLVEAVYSSDAGSGLPLKDQVEFHIKNLIHIT